MQRKGWHGFEARLPGKRAVEGNAAAVCGYCGLVDRLLAANADRKAMDDGLGATAEEWAESFGHSELAAYLRSLPA